MPKLSPPLKWHGGKHYLATRIISLMPTHTHYVEPYFGGGAVLLAKNPIGVSEVVNDLNGQLITFWQVLRCPDGYQDFVRMCEATPFSEEAYSAADSILFAVETGAFKGPAFQVAWAFFTKCRQSLAGRMTAFTPLSRTRTRRGMNEQASAWLTAVDGLYDVHNRLKRVVILNRKAVDVIQQQDGPDSLFYLDPPYLPDTRSSVGEYTHEMTEEEHKELLAVLSKMRGKFILSGYPSELYDLAATENNWVRHVFDLPNNAASGEFKERKTECLWTNFSVVGPTGQ